MFFKTNTDVTESYKTALLNNTDKNVEYGFMGVNGNLIAIGSFSTTTNNDSVIGAINEAISTDLIEEKKVFDGTSYSLKGVGSSKLESKVSAVKAYSLLQAVPNNQYQIMAGGFLSIFGGKNSIYTDLCEKTREEALQLMIMHAKQIGANAVINMRYDANEVMAGMTEFIQKVASKLDVRESGYRLITNIGKDGGQEVHHLHFHLIGGEPAGRLVRDRQEI